MQSLKRNTLVPGWAVLSLPLAGAAVLLASSQVLTAPPLQLPAAKPAAAAVAAIAAPAKAAIRLVAPARPAVQLAPPARPSIGFSKEDVLRAQLKFETVRWGGKPVQTLDESSRILLAKAAAEKAGLRDVGLGFQDVYGVIEAETSWIPRTGSSKDGTPNLGLAQFEPRTAQGLGLKDPADPVQAVFAAAVYIKHGAKWADGKLRPLKLSPVQHAAKLREGVSVYYNLSIKGRNKWDGLNTAQLPVETQRHIQNAAAGAVEAVALAEQLDDAA